MGLKSAHSQEFNFQESGEVDRLPIFKKGRALLKTVFMLHGQAFGYAHVFVVIVLACLFPSGKLL